MSDSGDFMAMSDPDFLAERTRVREELRELTERFRLLNEEFDRRARAAWTLASQAAVSVLRARVPCDAFASISPLDVVGWPVNVKTFGLM